MSCRMASAAVAVRSAWLRTACCIGLCLLLPSLSSAQQTVQANKPLTGTFTPSPDMVTGYRCYLNGKLVDTVSATSRSCSLPAVPAGSHLAEMTAFNGFGESVKIQAPFTAGDSPGPPGSFVITVTTTTALNVQPQADGSLAIDVVQVGASVSRTGSPSPDTAGR